MAVSYSYKAVALLNFIVIESLVSNLLLDYNDSGPQRPMENECI